MFSSKSLNLRSFSILTFSSLFLDCLAFALPILEAIRDGEVSVYCDSEINKVGTRYLLQINGTDQWYFYDAKSLKLNILDLQTSDRQDQGTGLKVSALDEVAVRLTFKDSHSIDFSRLEESKVAELVGGMQTRLFLNQQVHDVEDVVKPLDRDILAGIFYAKLEFKSHEWRLVQAWQLGSIYLVFAKRGEESFLLSWNQYSNAGFAAVKVETGKDGSLEAAGTSVEGTISWQVQTHNLTVLMWRNNAMYKLGQVSPAQLPLLQAQLNLEDNSLAIREDIDKFQSHFVFTMDVMSVPNWESEFKHVWKLKETGGYVFATYLPDENSYAVYLFNNGKLTELAAHIDLDFKHLHPPFYNVFVVKGLDGTRDEWLHVENPFGSGFVSLSTGRLVPTKMATLSETDSNLKMLKKLAENSTQSFAFDERRYLWIYRADRIPHKPLYAVVQTPNLSSGHPFQVIEFNKNRSKYTFINIDRIDFPEKGNLPLSLRLENGLTLRPSQDGYENPALFDTDAGKQNAISDPGPAGNMTTLFDYRKHTELNAAGQNAILELIFDEDANHPLSVQSRRFGARCAHVFESGAGE